MMVTSTSTSNNKMMMLVSPLSLLLLLLPPSSLHSSGGSSNNVNVALAARDNDYYYPGFVNPNTDYKMYWKDSINVLEDLDQFESLYIKYHHCVWSKYGTRYGTGEDYDEQDEDEDDENDNGCGGWGGEYYWYMGRTQCFKANAAYTLYGVLKGENAGMKGGSYCHKGTFINSFFTTYGAESFAGPLGLGVDTANSYCVSTDASGNNNNNNEHHEDDDAYNYAQVNDDYLGDDYTFYDYDEYTSVGTGCSADGNFVTDSYNGAFCHGADYNSTLDTMDDFNDVLLDMECLQIYSASGSNNNNKNNRRQLGRKKRRTEEENYEFDNMQPVDILAFSKSCSQSQYPRDCPDPYGLKRQYSRNIQRALTYKTGANRDIGSTSMKIASWVFFVAALFVMAAAYYVYQENEHDQAQGRRLRRRQQKKQSPKQPTTDSPSPRNGSAGAAVAALASSESRSIGSTGSRSSKTSASTSSKRSGKNFWKKLRLLPRFRRAASIPAEELEGDDSTEVTMSDFEMIKCCRGKPEPEPAEDILSIMDGKPEEEPPQQPPPPVVMTSKGASTILEQFMPQRENNPPQSAESPEVPFDESPKPESPPQEPQKQQQQPGSADANFVIMDDAPSTPPGAAAANNDDSTANRQAIPSAPARGRSPFSKASTKAATMLRSLSPSRRNRLPPTPPQPSPAIELEAAPPAPPSPPSSPAPDGVEATLEGGAVAALPEETTPAEQKNVTTQLENNSKGDIGDVFEDEDATDAATAPTAATVAATAAAATAVPEKPRSQRRSFFGKLSSKSPKSPPGKKPQPDLQKENAPNLMVPLESAAATKQEPPPKPKRSSLLFSKRSSKADANDNNQPEPPKNSKDDQQSTTDGGATSTVCTTDAVIGPPVPPAEDTEKKALVDRIRVMASSTITATPRVEPVHLVGDHAPTSQQQKPPSNRNTMVDEEGFPVSNRKKDNDQRKVDGQGFPVSNSIAGAAAAAVAAAAVAAGVGTTTTTSSGEGAAQQSAPAVATTTSNNTAVAGGPTTTTTNKKRVAVATPADYATDGFQEHHANPHVTKLLLKKRKSKPGEFKLIEEL